jgi:hypothetical protein
MSHILIKLFRTVTVFIKFNSEHTVIFGFMLLKKSTKMIANLGKFLRYGKNDIGIEINPKELAKFTKTTDYFKLCELLGTSQPIQITRSPCRRRSSKRQPRPSSPTTPPSSNIKIST